MLASKEKAVIHWLGRSYTLAQANALAVKEYTRKHYKTVAGIYRLILARTPDDVDACNNLGCALREMGRYDEALVIYDKVIALKPDYAMAHNNRGVILQTLKRHEEALASCDKAIALESTYSMGWHNRGTILQDMERYDEALASYNKAINLEPNSAALWYSRGITLHEMKRYKDALASYDKAVKLKPDYAKAYNNRALTLHAMTLYTKALASYAKAIVLKPDSAMLYNNQSITLLEISSYSDALISSYKAIALDPDYAEAWYNHSAALRELKRYDEALASCDKAIALKPDYAMAYNNRGDILVSKGDMPEAEKMFAKALLLKPDFANAFINLASIQKYSGVNHVDIKTIQTILSKPNTSSDDKELLYFALGKMFDDCGAYDEAFEYYRQGNQLCNAKVCYNAKKLSQHDDDIINVFSKDLLTKGFSIVPDSQSPLFIVGMPRSGTTLMASILSNHSAIHTVGELSNIIEFTSQLPKLMGNIIAYPQVAKHITPAVASHLIHTYNARLKRNATPDITYIIDKHPLNFRHLGLIAMLFPNARIIHCTRHPLDTALSNYFQRFLLSFDYSFDLENIGHFYNQYAKIMHNWRKIIPLPLLEISYEDMIENTEQTARQAIEFLGLEWDERCLSPHTNPYAVETASKWQVRQPIYQQSAGRWRHYEKHLEPLKEILQFSQ